MAEALSQSVAWRRGRQAAKLLRLRENLGDGRVGTERLFKLLGASTGAANEGNQTSSPLSFLLQERSVHARVVLRSRWETGQRFELARLLSDHLLFGENVSLLPATRSATFRQKVQRTFAAEFLSPFAVVEDMLHGDTSSEGIEEVARHFTVSTMTVETLLRNNGLIEREDGLIERERFADAA